jgi:hypothetical protein
MKELDNFSYGIRYTASIEQESDGKCEVGGQMVERKESREENYHREKKEELSRRVTLVMN